MTAVSRECPPAVAALDLTQPGWLEASAGSGKTYAIEHLVVRLLCERPELSLAGLLLVTFTEKAAGELKEKIRRRLRTEAARPDLPAALQARLQAAWLHFDKAAVHTIHGFCLQALKRYAFEIGGLFEAALTSDKVLLEKSLLALRRQAADGLLSVVESQALARTALPDLAGDLARFSQAFRFERGDTLHPIPDPNLAAELKARIKADIETLRHSLAGESDASLADQAWFIAFTALFKGRKGPGGYERRKKALGDLHRLLWEHPDDIEEWAKVFSRSKGILAAENAALLQWEGLMEPDADLASLLQSAQVPLAALPGRLAAWQAAADDEALAPLYHAVMAVGRTAGDLKRDQGCLTYDDMALRLWEALVASKDLAGLLRKQYPVAIVDEFQDTDPVQWALFRKLYLDQAIPLPLYLVGDPKQAIYGFRGGDLATYLSARRQLQDLSERRMATGFGLPANFRSREDLIAALNGVFSQPHWFGHTDPQPLSDVWKLPPTDAKITFLPARFGGSPRQNAEDHTLHPEPIILFEPPRAEGAGKEDLQDAGDRFIAASIAELLREPRRLLIPNGEGGLRPMHAGDVCILLRKHKDRQGLERWLRRLRIPFHIYKQTGLFEGEEAGHIASVLQAVAHPLDAEKQIAANLSALLNPDPLRHPVRETLHPQLESLRPLALAGQWPMFFRRLFEETGLFERLCRDKAGGEKISRYRHLAQRLGKEALASGLGPEGLADLLTRWRHQEMEEEPESEGDIRRVSDDGDKVTLLTMHASKGLEFPVVYIAYSAGEGRLRSPRLRHAQGMGWTFFLRPPDEAHREALRMEAIEEDKRLLYVALTRAQFKLFVPLVSPDGERQGALPNPLAGFVHQAMRQAMAQSPSLFKLVEAPFPTEGNSPRALDSSPPHEGLPASGRGNTDLAFPDADAGWILPDAFGRRRRLASYSLLAQRRKSLLQTAEGRRLEPDEWEIDNQSLENAAAVAQVTDKIPWILPPGARSGNLLHGCLENIDFRWARDKAGPEEFLQGPALEVIAGQMQWHGFEASLLPEVARLVFTALNQSLPGLGDDPDFRLSQGVDALPELEFMLPFAGAEAGGRDIPETRRADGYLWGYIDLVFRHRDRWYVIDWKSNWVEDYSPEALAVKMAEEAYDLQSRLYALAIHRWLRGRQKDYRADLHFGGVYYLFLRGLTGHGNQGIVGWRPSERDLEHHYPAYIAEALGLPPRARLDWRKG